VRAHRAVRILLELRRARGDLAGDDAGDRAGGRAVLSGVGGGVGAGGGGGAGGGAADVGRDDVSVELRRVSHLLVGRVAESSEYQV
jgi:hypothetical protein